LKKIVFLLAFISVNVYGQQVKFYGLVQDSIGNKLSSASVVVARLQDQAFQGFSITDSDGVFLVNVAKNRKYSVKVSYMGYRAVIDTIAVQDTEVYKKYVLKEDKQQLSGVEVKYEMPVQVKGDTLIYNADSFTTGNEKKAGDILKKMPGIEVDKDGTVKVEGKEVKKITVEGKEFFNGDSKLASKNIPASAVKKVEVLRNYNENNQLRSFEDNEDSYAINIKLKEGKKHFWFGEVTAGGGLQERYFLHPKLFYYSPKRTYNIIADANNVGEPALSWRDVFKMTGGMRRLFRKGNSMMNITASNLGFSVLKNDKAYALDSKLAAFNYNITLSNKLRVSGFILANGQQTETRTLRNTQYYNTGVTENSTDTGLQKSLTGSTKFTLDYEPNSGLNIKYNLLAKLSQVDENNNNISNIRADNEVIQRDETASLQQGFELYKTLKSENLITFSAQHQFDKNRPVYEAISTDPFFQNSSLIQLSPQQKYDLIQHKKAKNNKLSALFEYYYIINDISHLNISAGNESLLQNYDTGMSQKMDNGSASNLTDSNLINKATYTFSDFYTGLHYKLLWKKWLIRPSLNFHYYYFRDQQLPGELIRNDWAVLPKLSLKYTLKRSNKIRFTYEITNRFSDIQKYATGYVLSSYNRLKAGNRDLDNAFSHKFSLGYSKYSMRSFSGIWARLSYTKAIHPVRNKNVLNATDIISMPVNIYNPDETMSMNLSYHKRHVYWNYRMGINSTLMKYSSIVNNNLRKSQSFSPNFSFSASSNISGFFNFDLTYDLKLNQFDNGAQQSQYITHVPGIGLELSFFKKQLLIKTKYDYYHYNNKDNSVQNQYAFMNAEIFYQKKGSKWEFILSGTNLLQTESLNSESLNELYFATSQYLVQPNYWLLKVNYKL